LVTALEIIEVCNLWKCQCNVTVKESEKLCPWCKGYGGKFGTVSFKQRKFTVHQCILCKGEGKVDWLKAITKKTWTPYPFSRLERLKEIKMRCTGPLHCKKKLLRLFKEREEKNIGAKWKQVY
jgi:DnaJ-class molecular chaperone